MFSALVIALIASASSTHAAFGRRASGCPTGAPTNLNAGSLPNSTETGQSGYNNCGTTDSQTTMCQTAWINAVDDFCLWAPSSPNSTIGDSERDEVAWCTKAGHGARLIPDGTITGAHFVVTKDYVQITGTGDLTKINIATGDQGGELDPHGADGCGNPIGGILFTNALGQQGQQIAEWTNFMAADSFCFRACTGSNAAVQCNHIYDVMGCNWNMPGNYNAGSYDQCLGDDDAPMGVYNNGASTWYQGQSPTPSAGTAAATSSCTTTSSIGNGFLASTSTPVVSTSPATVNGTASATSGSASNTTSSSSSTASATSSTSKSGAGAVTVSFGVIGAAAMAAVAAFF